MAVTAYVLIQTEVGKAAHVRGADGKDRGGHLRRGRDRPLRRDRAGEAPSVDDLGRMVVSHIQLIEGITRTVTCPVVNL